MEKGSTLPAVAIVIGIGVVLVAALVAGGLKWHETPEFCAAICHVMDPYLASYTGEEVSATDGMPLLAQAHAEAGLECLDCHEATIEAQIQELKIYVSGDYPTPLKQREFADEECLACHEHGSREQIIEMTADYQMEYNLPESLLEKLQEKDYDLEQERNTNPHARPVNPGNPVNPHAEGGPMTECSRCHSMHRDPATSLDSSCFGCHHSRTFAPCETCHEE